MDSILEVFTRGKNIKLSPSLIWLVKSNTIPPCSSCRTAHILLQQSDIMFIFVESCLKRHTPKCYQWFPLDREIRGHFYFFLYKVLPCLKFLCDYLFLLSGNRKKLFIWLKSHQTKSILPSLTYFTTFSFLVGITILEVFSFIRY